MSGTFYVIATPIGNLEDITLRALRVLSEVDFVFCEDTRQGSKLLAHFDIKKPLNSYHAQSEEAKVDKIIDLLGQGKNIALISDAGTPAVSDPGALLVSKIREAVPDAVIIAIPGPSALTAALSVAGVPVNTFLFYGFLPHKKGRETLFKEIAGSEKAAVFYESPHRIMKTLRSLAGYLAEERRIVVARELTKVHEEVFCGKAKDALAYFESHVEKVRGEFVVIVSGQ